MKIKKRKRAKRGLAEPGLMVSCVAKSWPKRWMARWGLKSVLCASQAGDAFPASRFESFPEYFRRVALDIHVGVSLIGFGFILTPFRWTLACGLGRASLGPFTILVED